MNEQLSWTHNTGSQIHIIHRIGPIQATTFNEISMVSSKYKWPNLLTSTDTQSCESRQLKTWPKWLPLPVYGTYGHDDKKWKNK